MTIVRRLARPMLATAFIQIGLDSLRHPVPTVEAARPVLAPATAKVSQATGLPDDPELVVRASGALMAGSATLLALGKLPRLSALLMTLSLLPTACATALFWREQDPVLKREQRRKALANLGLIGGALLAAVDTQGKPGVAWRSQHAGKSAKKSAGRAAKDAKHAAKDAKRAAKHAQHDAIRTASSASADAKRAAKNAKSSASRAAHDAKSVLV
jgi:putative oxidoreductase